MDAVADHDDPRAWPPGTVRLETLTTSKQQDIILQPRPSDDPNDPLNWPQWRKNWNFGLTCYYSVMVFALIDAATPTWGPMQTQLGFSDAILNDSYAIGCGTLAFGAFLLIPFALKYGRRPIYILSTAVQFGISIWSARLHTVADLLLINALSCGVGALAEVIVQTTVADVFFVHERGMMNSIFVWSENAGSCLSIVAAGYITTGQGWRWVWWYIAMFFGAGFLLMMFTYEETKYTNINTAGLDPNDLQDPLAEVERRQSVVAAGKISKEKDTSSPPVEIDEQALERLTSHHVNQSIPVKTYWQKFAFTTASPGPFSKFARHSWQPIVLLLTIPGVAWVSLLYAAVIAISTTTTTTYSTYMTVAPYNFDAAGIGLMNLPPFIGTTIGSLICGPLSDRMIVHLARRNKGIYEPEMRLWVLVPFIPFLTAGTLMFGCGLNAGAAWPLIAVGYGLTAFGSAPIMSIGLTYITDSYTEIVGDALVSVSFTRNLLSTIFVFALTPWIDEDGMQNVFIVIAVLATAINLGVFVFIYYGKQFRVMTTKRYRYYASRQFEARKV